MIWSNVKACDDLIQSNQFQYGDSLTKPKKQKRYINQDFGDSLNDPFVDILSDIHFPKKFFLIAYDWHFIQMIN